MYRTEKRPEATYAVLTGCVQSPVEMHLVEVVREGGERVLLVPADGVDSSLRDVQDLVDEVDDGTVGFQVSLYHPGVVQVQALKDSGSRVVRNWRVCERDLFTELIHTTSVGHGGVRSGAYRRPPIHPFQAASTRAHALTHKH